MFFSLNEYSQLTNLLETVSLLQVSGLQWIQCNLMIGLSNQVKRQLRLDYLGLLHAMQDARLL